MERLLKLAFGNSLQACVGEYGRAITALHLSASRTANRLQDCLRGDVDQDYLLDFGPFLGRRFAEELAAALQGRIDPTRLIVSHQGASSVDFQMGTLNKSSLSWADDVLPNFEPTEKGVWSQHALKKNGGIVRGLLSGHMAYSVFSHGFSGAMDSLQEASDADPGRPLPRWVESVQKFATGEDLLSDMRRRAADAYSRFSKGIHFEFLPLEGAGLRPNDVGQLLNELIYVLATIALIADCSGLAHHPLGLMESATLFVDLSYEFAR